MVTFSLQPAPLNGVFVETLAATTPGRRSESVNGFLVEGEWPLASDIDDQYTVVIKAGVLTDLRLCSVWMNRPAPISSIRHSATWAATTAGRSLPRSECRWRLSVRQSVFAPSPAMPARGRTPRRWQLPGRACECKDLRGGPQVERDLEGSG